MTAPAVSPIRNSRAASADPNQLIHVLYVIDQLCEAGGAERLLLKMIRLLPKDRFRCSVITFKMRADLEAFHNFPCEIHVFPIQRTWDLQAVRTACKLAAFIRSQKVSVVHTFFETSDLWAGTIARLFSRCALISSRRDMGILRAPKHRIAYRLVNRLFHEVHAVSDSVRQHCIAEGGLDARRAITVYNGVSVPKRRSGRLPQRCLLPEGRKIITAVGHVRSVKGYDVLIRAATLVLEKEPDVLFVIAGDNHDPDHYQELQRMVAERRIEKNVLFLGAVEDVPGVLRESDVFVLPSRSEGLSNALLEAMALELPCVATTVGGNAEVVDDEKSGYLVPSEDAPALAGGLLKLLGDPHEAARMGRRGREIVEAVFSEQAMIDKLVRSYERVLRNR